MLSITTASSPSLHFVLTYLYLLDLSKYVQKYTQKKTTWQFEYNNNQSNFVRLANPVFKINTPSIFYHYGTKRYFGCVFNYVRS
jgi:hypothetical protein